MLEKKDIVTTGWAHLGHTYLPTISHTLGEIKRQVTRDKVEGKTCNCYQYASAGEDPTRLIKVRETAIVDVSHRKAFAIEHSLYEQYLEAVGFILINDGCVLSNGEIDGS